MSQENKNKYKKTNEETNAGFVARIVLSESRAMSANDIRDCADLRIWRTRTNKAPRKEQVQAHVCEAVKQGLLCKWKDPETKRMVYAPCDLMPSWADEKPIPAYTKGTGYTREVEESVEFNKADLERVATTPFLIEVLASYHMVSIDEIKERISNKITTARVSEDNRALFDMLKEMVA